MFLWNFHQYAKLKEYVQYQKELENSLRLSIFIIIVVSITLVLTFLHFHLKNTSTMSTNIFTSPNNPSNEKIFSLLNDVLITEHDFVNRLSKD